MPAIAQLCGSGLMSSTDPVTHWINQLIAGDRAAVQPLWEHCFQHMVQLARQRLRAIPPRMADGEDVAISAFDSFCRAAEQGRLPQLTDRDSLWSHLFIYTIRKASHLIRWLKAEKRDYRRDRDGGALAGPDGEPGLVQFLSREPAPEFAALVEEEYQRLLDRLPDDKVRLVAQLKLEGYTNHEIAARLGCVRRSVERMLELIRSLWKEEEKP